MDKLPDNFALGDVFIESQVQFRQWLVGGATVYESPLFWLSRGATDEQAENISQTWIKLNERILQNMRPLAIGTIVQSITPITDENWINLDGGSHAIAEYPLLADVVPASWIVGDDIVTPNMAGRTLVGHGTPEGENPANGYLLGVLGGQKDVTLNANQMPVHSHGTGVAGGVFLVGGFAGGSFSNSPATRGTGATTTGSAGNGEAHNNMPPYMVVYYQILAK